MYCVAGMQVVLSVWCEYPAKPEQHVCGLHPLASGYHRGDSEADDHSVVQGVRAISAAPEALGWSSLGVQRAAHFLPKAHQGPEQGEASCLPI
jgi:hypothetical protein